jgi:DNA-binding PadR family transcriptional regulator
VLELAVLGLLKEKPMSGYELQKALTAKLGAFWRVSFGSLYPCLKRLSADGALEVLDSTYMSRKKHTYRLTERGELLFQELLESADVHDFEQDRFPLRLAFFRYLNPESRIDQLERRRGYLQQRLADLRATLRAARDRMDAYTLSLVDHGLEEREREIAWLDRLIAAERGAVGLPVLPAVQPASERAKATRRARRRIGEQATGQPRPDDPDHETNAPADTQAQTPSDPSQPAAGTLRPRRRKRR